MDSPEPLLTITASDQTIVRHGTSARRAFSNAGTNVRMIAQTVLEQGETARSPTRARKVERAQARARRKDVRSEHDERIACDAEKDRRDGVDGEHGGPCELDEHEDEQQRRVATLPARSSVKKCLP